MLSLKGLHKSKLMVKENIKSINQETEALKAEKASTENKIVFNELFVYNAKQLSKGLRRNLKFKISKGI